MSEQQLLELVLGGLAAALLVATVLIRMSRWVYVTITVLWLIFDFCVGLLSISNVMQILVIALSLAWGEVGFVWLMRHPRVPITARTLRRSNVAAIGLGFIILFMLALVIIPVHHSVHPVQPAFSQSINTPVPVEGIALSLFVIGAVYLSVLQVIAQKRPLSRWSADLLIGAYTAFAGTVLAVSLFFVPRFHHNPWAWVGLLLVTVVWDFVFLYYRPRRVARRQSVKLTRDEDKYLPFQCLKCGDPFRLTTDGNFTFNGTLYCPYCGFEGRVDEHLPPEVKIRMVAANAPWSSTFANSFARHLPDGFVQAAAGAVRDTFSLKEPDSVSLPHADLDMEVVNFACCHRTAKVVRSHLGTLYCPYDGTLSDISLSVQRTEGDVTQ